MPKFIYLDFRSNVNSPHSCPADFQQRDWTWRGKLTSQYLTLNPFTQLRVLGQGSGGSSRRRKQCVSVREAILMKLVPQITIIKSGEKFVELKSVTIDIPEGSNVIIGQTHFIKTVEDLYEIMVGISSQVKFGIAFCEASGECLIRKVGNDATLQELAISNAKALGAGHSFIILLQEAYPINFLNAIKQCPEVCNIYCATANPVEVIIAETKQGRGILGVVDGYSPKGVEREEDIKARQNLLRQIGYKL